MTTKPDSLHMKLASHHLWLAFYPWGRHHWKNKFLKSISPSSLPLSQFDSVTCTLSIVFNVQKNRQAHLRGGGRGLQKAILYSFQEGFPKEGAQCTLSVLPHNFGLPAFQQFIQGGFFNWPPP